MTELYLTLPSAQSWSWKWIGSKNCSTGIVEWSTRLTLPPDSPLDRSAAVALGSLGTHSDSRLTQSLLEVLAAS